MTIFLILIIILNDIQCANCGTIRTLLFFDWQTGNFLINHTLLFTCLDWSVRNKNDIFFPQKHLFYKRYFFVVLFIK